MFNPKSNNYKDHPVYVRLMTLGPKRILSLDGGGIKGALTIGYLEEIEKELRTRFDSPSMVLSDYYDLVGGTSTGAIIATLVALGWSVDRIKELYLELGEKIFTRKKHILNFWKLKYFMRSEFTHLPLEEELGKKLKEITLGSDQFKMGLVIFAKRADTFSTWGFHNHPRNAFYEENRNIKVSDLLRATSAAPSYFEPKEIKFSDGESAVFIDGGVSMVNNPSLMLFMMVTVKGYGYQWRKGADNLLITSIGTGYFKSKIQSEAKAKLIKRRTVSWASELPEMFMKDALEQNQFMLQYFSNSLRPEYINKEAGNLSDDLISNNALLEYCRYNCLLDENNLRSLNLNYTEDEMKSLRKMEHGHNAKDLCKIGSASADKQFHSSHLPEVFDMGIGTNSFTVLEQEKALSMFLDLIQKNGQHYKKFARVSARIARKKEEVVSITKYGIESKNTAKSGDYIVTNLSSQSEKYCMDETKFRDRYELIRPLNSEESEYNAIGEVIGIQLTRAVLKSLNLPLHFQINANWGETQYASYDDYLVCPLDFSEIYRIGIDEFIDSYKTKD